MPYSFVAGSFHTKKNFVADFTFFKRFYTENGRFAFSSPLWGGGAYGQRSNMIILGSLERAQWTFY